MQRTETDCRWVLLAVAAQALGIAAGCDKAPPPKASGDANVLVSWVSSQPLWGSERFEVKPSGAVAYRFEPVDGSAVIEGHTTVDREQRLALGRRLETSPCCSLKSERSGIPDEARPELAIRVGSTDCKVVLWNGEWRDRAEARSCLDIIRPLMTTAARQRAPQGL